METMVVVVIVALAVVWAGWRLWGRRKTVAACGSAGGCGSCSCAAKPQPQRQRLVSLKR